ncbi:MAG TPA: hypothetical protein VK656_04125, partial [Candidatus Acidoferrum sp.]|nr:hypothetical protein [Candidatus Acidoferrum sp.]
APDDPHLGAYALRRRGPSDGVAPVLLEPRTEGRLSAALARHGEGPVVFYLGTAAGALRAVTDAVRTTGGSTTFVAPGPLGPSVLLTGGPASGPHLMVVEPEPR